MSEEDRPARRRRGRVPDRSRRRSGESGRRSQGSSPLPWIMGGLAALLIICLTVALIVIAGGKDNDNSTSPNESAEASDGTSQETEFDRQYRAAAGSEEALMKTVRWGLENNIAPAKIHQACRDILAIEPDNDEAHRILGHQEFSGYWLEEQEYDSLKKWHKRVKVYLDGSGKFRRTPHFDIVVRKDEDAQDLLSEFEQAAEDLLAQFFAKERKQFRKVYKITEFEQIPRRRIVIFPDQASYKQFTDEALRSREPRKYHGYIENGKWDPPKKNRACYLFQYRKDQENGFPFSFEERNPLSYQNFLSALYFKPKYPRDCYFSARVLEAYDVLGEEIDIARSDRYIVAVQRSERASSTLGADKFARLLEDHYSGFYEHFARDNITLPQPSGEMPMFIFKNRDEYHKYGERTGSAMVGMAEGHYEPSNKRMMTFLKTDEEEEIDTTVLHEGTHLLLDYLSGDGRSQLMWFNEGIAEYFAGYERDSKTGKITFGKIDYGRLQQLRLKILPINNRPKTGYEPLALEELFQYTYQKWHALLGSENEGDKRKGQLQGQVVYAEGWAFLNFMLQSGNPEYRKIMVRYIEAEIAGRSGWETFRKILNKTPKEIRKIETEFFEYVKSLY